MSEYETRKGRLKKLASTANEFIEGWCSGRDDIPDYYDKDSTDELKEYFMDETDEQYVIIGNDIYFVLEDVSLDDVDLFEANENSDGEIEYLLRYYNGGCGFSEAMEVAINKMKDK